MFPLFLSLGGNFEILCFSSSDHSLGEAAQGDCVNVFESPSTCKSNEKSSFNQPAAEIDLLTFTPIKEVQTSDKNNSDAAAKNEEKMKSNSLSVLRDLPPLNPKTESKKNQMNEIKAIIDQGLDLDKSEPKSSVSALNILLFNQKRGCKL